MPYPILAPNSSWYKGTMARSTITEIDIVNTYTPTGSETATWNADVNDTGVIKCYVTGTKLTIAGNGSGKIYANLDSSYAFSSTGSDRFSSLFAINGATLLDTSKVITLERLFYMCKKLESVDVSNWDTSNVQNMNSVFNQAFALKSAAVENWNTSSATDMGRMFQLCTSLESLDLSKWNVGKVTNMQGMFMGHATYGSMILTTIGDVGNWNTGNVTNMSGMFQQCSSLAELDVSNWDTGSCTNMSYMFNKCTSLAELDVSNWDTSSCTDMYSMFCNCSSLEELDVSNWNTGSCTDMGAMFDCCTALQTLDVSNWDTSNVTTFRSMFSGNSHVGDMKIAGLDVSNWDTSSATDMGWMFYGCGAQTAIDVSKWDVSKVTIFTHMFADNFNLKSIDVSNWNTSSAQSFDAMFNDCSSLASIDVSGLETANCKEFSQMFESCSNLTEIIGLENFDTSNGERFTEMFNGCSSLKELNLSSFNTGKANDAYVAVNGDTGLAMNDMFANCPNLKTIYVSNGWTTSTVSTTSSLFSGCTSLVGGNGTAYDSSRVGISYAQIDGKDGNPGYLTDIQDSYELLIRTGTLRKIGTGIRKINGDTSKYYPSEMAGTLNSVNMELLTQADIIEQIISILTEKFGQNTNNI